MVQVLAHGSQIDTAQELMFTHPFTRAFTDPELAAAANYAIAQFAGRQGHVTAAQIKAEHGASTGHMQSPPPGS